MIRRYLFYLICYFVLLISVGGNEGVYLTYDSIRSLLFPFDAETQGVSIILQILNLGLVLMFVHVIIKGTDDFFTLGPYAFSRVGKVVLLIVYIKQIGKELTIVILAKLIIDTLIALPDLNHFMSVISFTFSTLLTVFFWTMTVFFMRLNRMNLQSVYFLILVLTLTAQILSFSIDFFGIFVIVSLVFLNNGLITNLGKIVLCLGLILLNYYFIEKYEYLGR